MKKTTDSKTKKSMYHKVEDSLTHIAFAEAGELYSHKEQEKGRKKGTGKGHVCVEGETSSGLCV
jgi:hypothetical protein